MGTVINGKSTPDVQFLNESQAMEFVAKIVKFNLGITVEEFFERYNNGEYKDACNNPRLMRVLMMIPKAAGCGKK